MEYLILKLEGDSPRAATITAHIQFDGDPADAIKQGYEGEGRYAIVNWTERIEGELRQGPVELADVEDKKTREEAAQVAEAAAEAERT